MTLLAGTNIKFHAGQEVNDLYLPNVIFGSSEISYNMVELHVLLVMDLII